LPPPLVWPDSRPLPRFPNQDRLRAPATRPNSPPRRPGAQEERPHPRLRLSPQRSAVRRACFRVAGTPGIVPRRPALESRRHRAVLAHAGGEYRPDARIGGPLTMLFNTTRFFVFLAAVLALFYASPHRFRRYILLAASYFFYACWNPRFIALLLTLTAIDYTAAIWLQKVAPGPRKKALLILSLSANLGFLGFFKYYNFLAGHLALLLGKPPHSFFLDIVLPLGISFHTFQSMSYVVDVYRGEQKAVRSPIDYALFICFFPQLVAGPIVRAHTFFRDLFDWRPPSSDDVSNGIFLLVLGLTKKM